MHLLKRPYFFPTNFHSTSILSFVFFFSFTFKEGRKKEFTIYEQKRTIITTIYITTGTEKHRWKNNENSIAVTLNIEINFLFDFFYAWKFLCNFVTVLPSPPGGVYHSNSKLIITFLNRFFQKIEWCMKMGNCIKHIIMGGNQCYQSYFLIFFRDVQHKYRDWKLWRIVLYSRFDIGTVL